MKIVALTHYYIEENKAGGEMMLHGMLKALVEAGHDVTAVITDTKRKDTVIDGVKVLYGIGKFYTVSYDVLISQFQNTLTAFQDARRRKKPMVLVVHNDRRLTMTHASMLRKSDLIVFNTQWIRDKNPNTRASGVILHPPIDREHFFKVKKNNPEYITLVNVAPEKGSDIFYALAELFPNEKFLGVKGGYWKDAQVIKDLPNVTIIEQTANMRDDVYAKSKIVIMPSSYESYGMVAAEAMASGVPVIVSDTPGLTENVSYAGAKVSVEDLQSWSEGVFWLNNETMHKDMSRFAIRRAKEQHDEAKEELKQFIKAVEGLYNANK